MQYLFIACDFDVYLQVYKLVALKKNCTLQFASYASQMQSSCACLVNLNFYHNIL